MIHKPNEFAVITDPVVDLLGGPPHEQQKLAIQASPITYVAKTNAPFLILHGDADNLVHVDQSIRLYDALQKAKVESELIVTPGAGHSLYVFQSKDLMKKVSDFFEKHLKSDSLIE